MKRAVLLAVLLLLPVPALAPGVVRQVPAEFTTIQQAIDDCNDGDVVIIAPGRYTGPGNCDIDYLGKAVTVRSTDPNDPEIVAATVIDCNLAARGFHFHRAEGADSVLQGLTITRGRVFDGTDPAGGAAIACRFSSPTITGCVVTGNETPRVGPRAAHASTIYLEGSDAVISNCIISGNTAFGTGAAIFCTDHSNPLVANCTIVGNRAAGLTAEGRSIVRLANSILRENRSGQALLGCAYLHVAFSNVQGGWDGPGNIDADPAFVRDGCWDLNDTPVYLADDTWVEGDYHLKSAAWRWDPRRRLWTWDELTSRCIDAGDPDAPLGRELTTVPLDPNHLWGSNIRINMGAYGGTAQASMAPHEWSIEADYNNDGLLNFIDYAQIASAFRGIAVFGRLAGAAKRWLEMTSWCGYPFVPPGPASAPTPPDGSFYGGRSPLLSWTPGEGAVSHDVYFGSTRAPAFRVNQTATTYSPGLLESDTTFYWRIDEVNRYGVTTGPTWSFTTRPGGR